MTQSLLVSGRIWIMKPCGRSQGEGIFLIDRISQVLQNLFVMAYTDKMTVHSLTACISQQLQNHDANT